MKILPISFYPYFNAKILKYTWLVFYFNWTLLIYIMPLLYHEFSMYFQQCLPASNKWKD